MHRDDHRTPFMDLPEREKRRMMDPLGSRDLGAEGMAQADDLMTPKRPGPTLDIGLEFADPGPLFDRDPASEGEFADFSTLFDDPAEEVARSFDEGGVEDSLAERALGLGGDGDLGLGVEKELGSLDGL